MLGQSCGLKVAERLVKQNGENVRMHFPDAFNKYELP